MEKNRVIGKGTWLDSVASKIIEREKSLGRDTSMVRTESGLGASGIPHVGSLADAVRAYGVTLALRNMGYDSETVAFADDMDGLRRVPSGMPSWLQEHLLRPVSYIPDPFGCHDSYGEHMSGMLRDALDAIGVEYKFFSAKRVYEDGVLVGEIDKILRNSSAVGRIVYETVGQDKFMKVLPYFPVCKGCGRIYTANAYEYDPKRFTVKYRCEGVEIKGRRLEGCGYEGEADIRKGEGKLAWKVEFAARWARLDIRFEAYGKDIADSVRVNDLVAERILGFVPPYHIRYEMFLDEHGRKISKSAGNILTPQEWLKYGTPESLLLLVYKRYVGSRRLSYKSIPKLMDEVDYIEDVYFGKQKGVTKTVEMRLKGLYEYIHHLRPPSQPKTHVPYNLLVDLAMFAPRGKAEEFVISRLLKYGYKVDDEVLRRLKLAMNYAQRFGRVERGLVELSENERAAVRQLASKILEVKSPEELQHSIFELARSNGIEPQQFFKKLYEIFLGIPRGPRLGPYLFDIGKDEALRLLEPYLRST
ncbi:MAG: lysine--tRNA ligase [Candidatus Terraquivivens tikiterensis]|uniref:Lysine--tRNA ligase n=1 Tax=Candidatus Terraquivivens tikiterensis TaxID=1980982 RepID=A0A2R7Y312_9ARCH|nr:MAG: lysine--tRNA ligase [Candidatus Terraquivivens tikiterensis]